MRHPGLCFGFAMMTSGCLNGLFGSDDAGGASASGAGLGAACMRDGECRGSLRCEPASHLCVLRGDALGAAAGPGLLALVFQLPDDVVHVWSSD